MVSPLLVKGIVGSIVSIIVLILIAQILGQIQTLLEFIVDHFMLLMGLVIGVGLVISMILYVRKRNLEMKNMMVFTGFMVAMIMILVFVLPVFGIRFGTFEAKLTYHVCNQLFGNVIINSANVYDFKETSLLSVRPAPLGIIWTRVQAKISVVCDDKEVFRTEDGFDIAENTCQDRIVTIYNLPKNAWCSYSIDLICDECSAEVEWTGSFKTPRG